MRRDNLSSRATTAGGNSFASCVSMPCFFWYFLSHFTRRVAMPAPSLGQRAEFHLPHRQAREPVVAHHAHVELAPFDVFLHQRIGLHLVVHELDALLELRLVRDDRRLRDAERRVLGGRLHEQRVLDLARQAQLDAAAEHGELRRGNAVDTTATACTAACRATAAGRADCSRYTADAAARGMRPRAGRR